MPGDPEFFAVTRSSRDYDLESIDPGSRKDENALFGQLSLGNELLVRAENLHLGAFGRIPVGKPSFHLDPLIGQHKELRIQPVSLALARGEQKR